MFGIFTSRRAIQGLNWRQCLSSTTRRKLIAPPRPNSGPLLARRADRELPDVKSGYGRWVLTIPPFIVILAGSALAIFNYEKSSSPIIAANLYALRTSPRAREALGDEIYFRDKIPWISGEMNQLHGRIDIGFGVKGSKATGYMRFKCTRKTRSGYVLLLLLVFESGSLNDVHSLKRKIGV